MYYFIFQILFFAFLLYHFFKKEGNIITSYITIIWLISSVFSLFFYYILEPSNMTISGLVFFDVCFFLCVFSVRGLNNVKVNISTSQVNAIFKFMVFIGVISVLPFFENLVQVITSFFSDSSSEDLLELYNQKMDRDTDIRQLTNWLSWPGRICNSIVCRFQQLSYFLFFILLGYCNMKKKDIILIALPILDPLLYGIAKSGRGAVIFAFIYLIFLFLVFKDKIKKITKKILFRFFMILGGGFGVLLLILTVARLSSDTTESTAFMSFSLYIGEGQVRFLDEMWHIKQHTMGDNSFSFFKSILGESTFTNALDRREFWNFQKTGVDPRFFYTFIGDIFSDLGYYSILFFGVIHFVIKKSLGKGTVGICTLYMVCVFCYVMVNGFTIYPFKIYDLTLNILTCLGVLIVLTNVGSKNKKIV